MAAGLTVTARISQRLLTGTNEHYAHRPVPGDATTQLLKLFNSQWLSCQYTLRCTAVLTVIFSTVNSALSPSLGLNEDYLPMIYFHQLFSLFPVTSAVRTIM